MEASTESPNMVNALRLRQPRTSQRPRLSSRSCFQRALASAINHHDPKWRKQSLKLLEHPLAKRSQRLGLGLQLALAHCVL
jgi:hypothetical protein